MSKKLSIEIFRDIETPDIDPQIAVAGIELVNQLTNESLEVYDTSRKIRVSKAGEQIIKSSAIRWPMSSIDMRLVLTTRKLQVNEDAQTIGFSHINDTGGGVAVISTFDEGSVSPQSATAHELGHLFRLQYGEEAHCSNPDCIMHSNLKTRQENIRIQKRGIQAWRERRGYQRAEYQTVKAAANESFCDPCQYQLAKRAFFMIARKNGRTVPQGY